MTTKEKIAALLAFWMLTWVLPAHAWNVTVEYTEPHQTEDGQQLGLNGAPGLAYTTIWYQRPGKPLKSVKIPASSVTGGKAVSKVLHFTDDTQPCLYQVDLWATATSTPAATISLSTGKITKYYGEGKCLCD